MKKLFITKVANCLMLAAGLMVASCSNDENVELNMNEIPDFEVSTLGQWLPTTRAATATEENMPVLHFRDQAAYE